MIKLIAPIRVLHKWEESFFAQSTLFDYLPFDEFLVGDDLNDKPEVVVIFSFSRVEERLVEKLRSENIPRVFLYHLGDEFGVGQTGGGYEFFDGVFRNYFCPELFESEKTPLLWIPNGFRTGVGPRQADQLKSVTRRSRVASFAGWLDNPASWNGERTAFKSVASACTTLVSSEGFAKGLNPGAFAALMEDSILAPCPAGNSPETIRLYDSLECGCIPVVLKSRFLHDPLAMGSFGPTPFVVLESWSEYPSLVESFRNSVLTNPEWVKQKAASCSSYWGRIKSQMRIRVRKFIQGANRPESSDDIWRLSFQRQRCSWLAQYGPVQHLAESVKAKKILEIGVAYGFHADFLLERLPTVSYTGLDPYIAGYDATDIFSTDVQKLFNAKTQQTSMDRLFSAVNTAMSSKWGGRFSLVRASSSDEMSLTGEVYDLIYIDGDHTFDGVLKDLAFSWVRLRGGGVLCGDDYNWPGVNKACEEFFSAKGLQLKFCSNRGFEANPTWFVTKPLD